MSGLRAEGAAFLTAALTGMVLACAYFCLVRFRKAVAHPPALTAAEDVLYWIVTAVYVFVQIFQTSSGSIRWYFVAGVFAGVVFFFRLCRRVSSFWRKIAKKREKK